MDAINGEHFVVTVLLILRISLYKKKIKKALNCSNRNPTLQFWDPWPVFTVPFCFGQYQPKLKIPPATFWILFLFFIFGIKWFVRRRRWRRRKHKSKLNKRRTYPSQQWAFMLWVTWTAFLLSSSLFHPHLHISLLFFSSCWLISLLLFLFFQFSFVLTFRVCLVEWILGRMEKKEKKKEGKLFEGCLVGREGEKICDEAQVFFP